MESPSPSSASLSTVAVKEKVGVPSSDQPLEDPRKVTYSSNLTFKWYKRFSSIPIISCECIKCLW